MTIQFNFGRKFVQHSFFIASERAQKNDNTKLDLYTFMFTEPYREMVDELRAWVAKADVITDARKL